jgi:hypothetical protein
MKCLPLFEHVQTTIPEVARYQTEISCGDFESFTSSEASKEAFESFGAKSSKGDFEIGTFFLCGGKNQIWLNITLQKVVEMAAKEQPILYPLFEDMKKFTLDPFWCEQLGNFACNKFPVGLRYDPIQNHFIVKIDGKKADVIVLPEIRPDTTDNLSAAYEVTMDVLRNKLHMRSSRELKLRQEEMDRALQKHAMDLDCEFKKIKPRVLRDQLIMNFITELKERYGLSPSELKKLINTIQQGFQFKSLGADDVEYTDGVVKGINGLTFDEEERVFSIPPYPPRVSKPEKQPTNNRFLTAIDKFFKDDAMRVKRMTI